MKAEYKKVKDRCILTLDMTEHEAWLYLLEHENVLEIRKSGYVLDRNPNPNHMRIHSKIIKAMRAQ